MSGVPSDEERPNKNNRGDDEDEFEIHRYPFPQNKWMLWYEGMLSAKKVAWRASA
jgi:hypothetical protein